ncbi:MAG: hypothetical protein PHE24_04850 [Patescibacteria group bacterium]|nr:hypothetical protein [Patescibacteria group bacterium]
MDEGAADVGVIAVKLDYLSLPERLMLAEEAGKKEDVKRILSQVHYCWPQIELAS